MYDISNNRLRTKIANRLTGLGYERIQLSVFTGITHPRDHTVMWSNINKWIDEEEGMAKFYVFKMTKNNFKSMESIGALEWDLDYLTGSKNSIFI